MIEVDESKVRVREIQILSLLRKNRLLRTICQFTTFFSRPGMRYTMLLDCGTEPSECLRPRASLLPS